MLKTQEDFEMIKSKFDTFKDIEIVISRQQSNLTAQLIIIIFRLCVNRLKTKESRTKRRSKSYARDGWIC